MGASARNRPAGVLAATGASKRSAAIRGVPKRDSLPPGIPAVAQELCRGALPDFCAVVDRLADDPRMQKIWRRLDKNRNRRTGERQYPASLPAALDPWTPEAEARLRQASELRKIGIDELAARFEIDAKSDMEQARQAALAAFFVDLVFLAAGSEGTTMVTERERDKARLPYAKPAARLRTEAKQARQDGLPSVADNLDALASVYDRKAAEVGAGLGRLLVKNQRRDPSGDAFLIVLCELLSRYFSKPALYGVAAKIANVALDRNDLTAIRVRQIVRAPMGIPAG